ncbi:MULTISPECIES: DUF397 domain-containing protein [unclassified Nocardiopsis]|uniref:DUF397 domain-containing protein n=1 Tax=unclassified Nocardiopsis TaxID=2649073 RepID=UPI0033FCC1E1
MYSSQEFHKSSYSANEAACVEVAEGRSVLVRDTQNREAGHLTFASQEWAAMLSTARTER